MNPNPPHFWDFTAWFKNSATNKQAVSNVEPAFPETATVSNPRTEFSVEAALSQSFPSVFLVSALVQK